MSPEEEELSRLLREATLEKECEAARARFEHEEMERIRQRADDVGARRQEMTWWEVRGLSTPPRGMAAVPTVITKNEESTDESDRVYPQNTGDNEEAIRRVGEEMDNARANML